MGAIIACSFATTVAIIGLIYFTIEDKKASKAKH